MTKVEQLQALIKELWPDIWTDINGDEENPCLEITGKLVSNHPYDQPHYEFPISFWIWENGTVETSAEMYPVTDEPHGPYYVNGEEVYPRQTLMINPEVLYF